MTWTPPSGAAGGTWSVLPTWSPWTWTVAPPASRGPAPMNASFSVPWVVFREYEYLEVPVLKSSECATWSSPVATVVPSAAVAMEASVEVLAAASTGMAATRSTMLATMAQRNGGRIGPLERRHEEGPADPSLESRGREPPRA